MKTSYKRSWLLRLLAAWQPPRFKGLAEMLYGRRLAALGTTWVDFGHVEWKLDLREPTHRWIVYGGYEDETVLRLIDALPEGAVIVDSGANIGQMIVFYTRTSRRRKILAVEPGKDAGDWLTACRDQNQLSGLDIIHGGLGAEAMTAHLQAHAFDDRRGSQNFISATGEEKIDLYPLSYLLEQRHLPQVEFWKLDTEGFELPALKGAEPLLAAHKIKYLWIEVAGDYPGISAYLAQFGYKPHSIDARGNVGPFDGQINYSMLFAAE